MKELELVLATIANLGAAGKEAFIWWLVFDKFLFFIGFLCAIFVIYKVIMAIRNRRDREIAIAVARAAGFDSYDEHNGPQFRKCMAWVESKRVPSP